jgi:hypothetical protein
MDVSTILDRVRKTYAGAAYYRDRGWVRFLGEAERVHGQFRTIFLRSIGIRFEHQNIQSADGTVIHDLSFGVLNGVIAEVRGVAAGTLAVVIARMTGLTWGTVQTVPHLLLPSQVPGRSLAGSSSVRLVAVEPVDSHECFRIEHLAEHGGEAIFISTQDFTVRQIIEDLNLQGARLLEAARARNIDVEKFDPQKQVTRYEPQIGEAEPAGLGLEW